MVSLKEIVANDRKVRFTHYKAGELWYVTRYIRKHIAFLEQARAANGGF